MVKLRRWLPSILCLLVIWVVTSLIVRGISWAKPSEAGTLELLKSRPASTQTAESRGAWRATFASKLSRLDLDARHLVLMNSDLRAAFLEMTPEDQLSFLDSIKTPGATEFLEGSKSWSLGRYERLMRPALADLDALRPGTADRIQGMLVVATREAVDRAGIFAYLKATDPVSRFDALPFIERVQKHAQLGR